MASRSVRRATALAVAGVVLAVSVGGCGNTGSHPLESGAGAQPTPPPTTAAATSSTAPPAPPPAEPAVWPLTGRPLTDPAAAAAGVVVVKIDNSPQARPHAGVNRADQVYELQVEGITRFMVLFHSDNPERVGPVRSARSSDLDLMGNLHRPLLMWSGGNPGVTREVTQAQEEGLLVDVGHPSDAGSEYYRDNNAGRVMPHNLFSNVVSMRANHTPPGAESPGQMFSFRSPTEAPSAGAGPAAGMTIDFGLGVRVDYVWDAERTCWDRFQVDDLHPRPTSAFLDEDGVQVCPDNVVILFLSYAPDPVDSRSPKALSVGEGDGLVLTAGTVTAVHWHRATAGDGWNLTDAVSGDPVGLTPGRTWVALPQRDDDVVIPMDPATAAGLLAVRR